MLLFTNKGYGMTEEILLGREKQGEQKEKKLMNFELE